VVDVASKEMPGFGDDMKRLTVLLGTSVWLVVGTGLIVLANDLLIMLLINGFYPTFRSRGAVFWDFFDPIMLAVLVSAALYVFVFRSMSKQKSMLERQLDMLRHNEQLAVLIEAIPDAVFLKDGEGRWLVINQPAKQLFQLHNIPWQGKTEMELADMHPAYRAAHEGCLASDEKAWQTGRLLVDEETVTGEDGQCRIIEARKMPMFDEVGRRKGLVIIGRDITERKASGARIERLTKLYRALSEINQAIVRMDDASTLFPLVCRMAVDFGGMRMAWIGQLDKTNDTIKPVVSYGCGVEYLNDIVISSKESVKEGRGPTGTAYRENRNVIVDNFKMSSLSAPWRESALRYGWSASGSFPIQRAEKPFAVFTVYHSHSDAFDAEMIGLLDEMSRDISFALDSFDRESERKQALAELISSERHFRAYFERSMVGMAATSLDKGWLEVNDALCEMLGYSREELMRLTWSDLTHPDDLSVNEARFNQILRGEIDEFVLDKRFLRKDGTPVYVHIAVRALRKEDGSLDYVVSLIEDITERKQAMQDLRITATAFETQEGIMITDRDTRILRVNSAFTRLTGYSATEVIGQTPAILKSGRQNKAFYRNMWETLARDKYWQGEILNRRKNGQVYPEWQTITVITDEDGQVINYVGVSSDLTLRKEADEQIHELAFYDPLTHLPNRRLLRDRLQQAMTTCLRSQRGGAVLFIDLDNFKVLNDIRGHDIGDLLLIQVAERLHDCARSNDTIARLGGDEFVVLLEGLSKDAQEVVTQAQSVGKKILAAISRPFDLHGIEYHGSSSIGISLFCGDEISSMDDLLKHADVAMYQAKTAGRNTMYFFDPVMQAKLEMRAALTDDLRQALPQQQLKLYYQVQVNEHGVVGAEALLRWQHPVRGLVSPLEFIPLAEESGLIVPIGQWVLQTACAQLKQWESDPRTRHLQLAVNVSARQFRQPDLIEQVLEVLNQSGIDPLKLEFELTESLVLDNIADSIDKMQALRDIGIRFSLDDFGTGQSSLTYLKRLPLDQIKIDQSFVRDIITDPNDAAIVQTIIGMANNLGLNVIAEGVETEQQRDFLERNGCRAYQGYLFGKPVPIEAFQDLIFREG
jgi:diguanylate cyclase (GGDEF)-like protein/PAS domain S-box-containing protein